MKDLIEPLVEKTISALRKGNLPARPENSVPFAPGMYFSWDATEGTVELDLGSAPECLLSVNARVARAPRWFGLNISLGGADFAAGDVLGAVFDLQGGAEERFAAFVRSARDGQNRDTTLRDSLVSGESRTVQAVLHSVGANDPMSRGGAHQTLVLRLPRRDFTLTLRDMQIFRLHAACGLRSTAPTLSSFAVVGVRGAGVNSSSSAV